MRRRNLAVWLLLGIQFVPLLLIIAGALGAFDFLGRHVLQSVALAEAPGLLIDAARLVTAYWFIVCVSLTVLGSLLAVVMVAFDGALTKVERFVWAISFVFGQPVTVTLYCVLRLLGSAGVHHPLEA